MGYRNKTYVAFDGDNDMWAYSFLKGWNANENVDFAFHDAHGIKELTNRAQNEVYIKKILRERLQNSKQFVLLVGESTKHLRKYVRWEIEGALMLNIPIIVVNLNGKNGIDTQLCPAMLKHTTAVHGPYKKAFIKQAIDDFAKKYTVYKNKYKGKPIAYKEFD